MLDRTNITRLEELARDLARAQPSLRLIGLEPADVLVFDLS